MRRSFISLVGAGGELVRFLGLAALSSAFLGNSGNSGALSLFRFASSPQLLFALGFFFLWYRPERYGIYRPLLAAGKILCVLTLAPLIARFALSFRENAFFAGNPSVVMTSMLAFLLWDAAATVALIVSLRKFPERRSLSSNHEPTDPLSESAKAK